MRTKAEHRDPLLTDQINSLSERCHSCVDDLMEFLQQNDMRRDKRTSSLVDLLL